MVLHGPLTSNPVLLFHIGRPPHPTQKAEPQAADVTTREGPNAPLSGLPLSVL